MKVKRTEQKKGERVKLKLRKIKKNEDMAYKDTTTNLTDDIGTYDTQSIPLRSKSVSPTTEKAATQSSFKRKKRQSSSKGTINQSSNLQSIMNDFTGWDTSEQETYEKIEIGDDWKIIDAEKEKDVDDDWLQITPKEKRNICSPCVVEMLSDSVTSLNLPQTFQHKQDARSDKDKFHDNDAFELNAPSTEEGMCVVVAESINPKHDTHMQTKHSKQASPVNTGENSRDEHTSDNKLEDINVNNIFSPGRSSTYRKFDETRSSRTSSTYKKFDENRSPRRTVSRNSNTDMHCSPQFKNTSKDKHKMCNQKVPEVYCLRNLVIVIMEKNSKLCFTGKLSVKVLYGAVKIYGFILDSSVDDTKVYSPKGYSNVAIETSEVFTESSIEDVWTALATEGITRDSESVLQVDIDRVQPGTAILVLKNFENNLTQFLKTYFPHAVLFPSVKHPSYYPWTDPKRAEIILQANLHLKQYDDSNYKRLVIDPCITTDIAEKMLNLWRENKWSCTLIAGGKNVGKSTNVRCLINSLLRTSGKVVLVDVDPGQAECTPPACISYSLIEEPLMGPNFTHLRMPVYQLFIDDVNVSRCVTRYLEGVKMLVERLKECPALSRLPIVVNTMGFTQSIGWDIVIFTIKLIRPSIILQIQSNNKKNYKDVLSAEVVNKQEFTWTFCDERFIDWSRLCEHDLCLIYSQAELVAAIKNEWNMEPYQQRELMLMSYISDIIRDNNFVRNAGPLLSINQMVPYTAPFSSLCIIPQRLFGVPASRALSVINGNIVALCGIDLTEEPSQKSKDTLSLRVLTQRSPLCTCYGFGIIRGVDMERQEIFINTPLSISIMQHVNCLAGCIPVPPTLLQLHQSAPYVGRSAVLPTSREPRRGFYFLKKNRTNSNKTDG